MKWMRLNVLVLGILLLAGAVGRGAAAAPDFKEIYDLVRTNAVTVSEAELERAAAEGLINALNPKVSLVTNHSGANSNGVDTPLVTKVTVFEESIGYVRVSRVDKGLAQEINDFILKTQVPREGAGPAPTPGDWVKGLVLDLRYTGGTDYAAAAAAADLFLSKAVPLLNAGAGVVSSHDKTNAITVPVAVLVNRETAGAAEALAAVLREIGAGLILGGQTAGRALVTRDFPLKNGGQLRIATGPVTLGDGSAMSTQGLKPDIDVTVNGDDERAYYADAFRVVPRTNQPVGPDGSSTNQAAGTNTSRRRMNEADLVRARREGLNLDLETAARPPEPVAPVISDPALARALDLLKGLAVVRTGR